MQASRTPTIFDREARIEHNSQLWITAYFCGELKFLHLSHIHNMQLPTSRLNTAQNNMLNHSNRFQVHCKITDLRMWQLWVQEDVHQSSRQGSCFLVYPKRSCQSMQYPCMTSVQCLWGLNGCVLMLKQAFVICYAVLLLADLQSAVLSWTHMQP